MTTWREALARQISPTEIIATTLGQLGVPRWFSYKIFGAPKYLIHKTRVRDSMKGKPWFTVMHYYDWMCACCRTRNYKNKEVGKPKMQVDHINPVYRWGENNWENLQVLCQPCNIKKGIKPIDYRRRA